MRDGNKCGNNIQTETVEIVESVLGVRNVQRISNMFIANQNYVVN